MTDRRTAVLENPGSMSAPWSRRGRSRGTASACAIAVTATCIVACTDPPAPPPEVLRPVKTLRVAQASPDRPRTYSGVAQASVEASLSFRVPGSIVNVPVHVGDRIRANALIAQLDRTDYELELQRAQAALDQALANLRNSEANFDRVQLLYESQNASQNAYDSALATAESARAAVESAERQLDLAWQRLGYTALRSPIAGAVATVQVEANENVGVGQPIALITAGSRPEVTVSIPEGLIGRISRGDSVDVTFAAYADRTLPATVTEVGVAATGSGTTFPVTVRLDADATEVRSGMAADVTFHVREDDGEPGVVLPSTAVVEDREGRFVFVLEPGEAGVGTVRRRDVTIGQLREGGLEILEGLEIGEQVVTAGARRLSDGQRVRLQPQDAT